MVSHLLMMIVTESSPRHDFAALTQRRRRTAVILLVVAGSVNYLDRSAVAVGNPNIRHDLHLSFGQMGLLLSAFAWAYGLAQIPAGLAVDRFGPRRALPISLFNSSSALAPALAPPLLTLLMVAFGWRTMFLVAGVAGLAIAIAWVLMYREPAQAHVPPEDLAAIRAGDGPPSDMLGVPQLLWLLKFRTTWGMFLGFFGVVYLSWMYATWLPGYLETQRHMSVSAAGYLSAIPLAAGFIGAVAGGFVSTALGRRMDASAACRLPIIAGMLAAGGLTVAGALAPSTGTALACMAGGLFAANMASSCGWALAAVVAPNNAVAGLEAVQNVGGSLGGALAPFITGAVVQQGGSFIPAFLLAGAIAVSSAVFYALMARRPISAPA
jgi:MFS family permease